MRRFRHLLGAMLSCILALLLALGTWACSTPTAAPQDAQATSSAGTVQVEHGSSYTSKEEVCAYLHEYGELPPNFISKTKAKRAGWVPSEGNLDEVCPGMSIGGSVFYNDDGKNAISTTMEACGGLSASSGRPTASSTTRPTTTRPSSSSTEEDR